MEHNFNESPNSEALTSGVEIDSLNLTDLDVEELENRLELATGFLQAVPCLVVYRWHEA